MTSDLQQFQREWHSFKGDIERTLAMYRDNPPPSVSKLMLGIQKQIEDINIRLSDLFENLNGRVQPLEQAYQRAIGMGVLAKVGWSVLSVYVVASSFGLFQMYVKVSHIDQDIRLTIQEELRK